MAIHTSGVQASGWRTLDALWMSHGAEAIHASEPTTAARGGSLRERKNACSAVAARRW